MLAPIDENHEFTAADIRTTLPMRIITQMHLPPGFPFQINFQDHTGSTLLHFLASRRHAPDVAMVLSGGPADPRWSVEIDRRDREGATALHRAVQSRHYQTVAAFIDALQRPPGHPHKRAVCTSVPMTAGQYLNLRDNAGRTILHDAVASQSFAIVDYLRRLPKLELEPRDNNGRSPLDDARKLGHEKIIATLETERAARAEARRKRHADPLTAIIVKILAVSSFPCRPEGKIHAQS